MYRECRIKAHSCNDRHCKAVIESFLAKKPVSHKWALDRLDPFGFLNVPDLPIFLVPGYELLGHYWFKQTHRESTDCYIARCQQVYQARFADHLSEGKFVGRVLLGLRSFSISASCFVENLESFEDLRAHLSYLYHAGETVCHETWKQFLFPNKKRVSRYFVQACLEKVRLLRQALRPPKDLIDHAYRVFATCATRLRLESIDAVSRLEGEDVREFFVIAARRASNNRYYLIRVKPRVSTENLYLVKRNPLLSLPLRVRKVVEDVQIR